MTYAVRPWSGHCECAMTHNKQQIFNYLPICCESRKESLFQKLKDFLRKQCASLYFFNVEVNCILVQININCQSFENAGMVQIKLLLNFLETILLLNQVHHVTTTNTTTTNNNNILFLLRNVTWKKECFTTEHLIRK